jgi:hypothetical protein
VSKSYIMIKLPDGTFVGSPTDTCTDNPHLAATFNDARPRAEALAAEVGGEVVDFTFPPTGAPPPLAPPIIVHVGDAGLKEASNDE